MCRFSWHINITYERPTYVFLLCVMCAYELRLDLCSSMVLLANFDQIHSTLPILYVLVLS